MRHCRMALYIDTHGVQAPRKELLSTWSAPSNDIKMISASEKQKFRQCKISGRLGLPNFPIPLLVFDHIDYRPIRRKRLIQSEVMASAYKSTMRAEAEDASLTGSDLDEISSDTISAQEDSDEDMSDDEETSPQPARSSIAHLPVELRNRILTLTTRGVSHRHRHLLNDLSSLLPHTYKDTKLDTKSSNRYNATLNALADLHSCNHIFFLEARKRGQDLYLWLAGAPNGPTIKFSVSNIHTMTELDFGGNCLKGGRGVVVFDKSFDENMEGYEHKTLIREMLKGVFCVPSKGVRGMKPFVDRIIGIYGLDGKIWIRIYEIREGETEKEASTKGSRTGITLVEVGPRMVLTPILVLEGSFGGPVIYENKQYVSPNQLRSEVIAKKASKYAERRGGLEERVVKRKSLGLESGFKKKRSKLHDAELFG